jgi:hypothetical protein
VVAFLDFINKNKPANATINIIGIISVTLIISGPAAFLASNKFCKCIILTGVSFTCSIVELL